MSDATDTGKKTAGALDIRVVVGSLMAIYAVVLLLMGIFGDEEGDKTGDVNANLWAGVVLVFIAVGFLGWAKLRPIVVATHDEEDKDLERPGH
jgi:hypothetical protein